MWPGRDECGCGVHEATQTLVSEKALGGDPGYAALASGFLSCKNQGLCVDFRGHLLWANRNWLRGQKPQLSVRKEPFLVAGACVCVAFLSLD